MSTWMTIVGVLALAALLFWPGQGLVGRWLAARRLARRVRREDAMKHILKCEINGGQPTIESLAGHLEIPTSESVILLEDLEDRGLLSLEGGRLRLNRTGRDLALHLIRAHRLWESYLSEETGVAEADWHLQAERQEHLLSPQDADALAARLGHPTFDPHGDVIPARGEPVPGDPGMPLNAAALNQPLRVTHVEDEPSAVYAQLTAQGIRPGMRGLLTEKLPHRLRFWANGEEHVLAPLVANNISVQPLEECTARDLLDEEFLSGLEEGQCGRVLGLAPACRGPERRRLLDLGFVPGTEVCAEMRSPGGDPTAYRLRGTLIALRKEQAGLIRVSNLNRQTS
jgi:DtxR family Mn-dependent transcriptional regulator